MCLVNFVRGIEPRMDMDLYEPVQKQIDLMKQYEMPKTFLLQFDAMKRADFQKLFIENKSNELLEIGVWFENCRELIEKIGLEWKGREGYDWDWHVNVGFLEGYTPTQRERIIDEVFELYKELFGEYPKVAGSWLLDAYSMRYMQEKYGMKAFCICREQYAIDAYTLWGGYYSGGYYPSKYNMLCPAQSVENQINVPVFRMLGIDPIHEYDEMKYSDSHRYRSLGRLTLEPVWTSGQTATTIDWFFKEYYTNPCLSHSLIITGQENSFGWENFGKGYVLQIEKIAEYSKQGVFTVEKLGDIGDEYKRAFTLTPPAALSALSDWSGKNNKSIWYNSRYYRANLFFHDGFLFFRDICKFNETYQEEYLHDACWNWCCRYDNLPIVNALLWSKNGKESGLFLEKQVENIALEEKDGKLIVCIDFKEGAKGRIVFDEKKILFENCETLEYNCGELEEITTICNQDKVFRYSHNGFEYSIVIDGNILNNSEIFVMQPIEKELRIIIEQE